VNEFARLSDLPSIRDVRQTWTPAFRERVDLALEMLSDGRSREDVRKIHGSVVLHQAEALRK
jgi:hypothetical protein